LAFFTLFINSSLRLAAKMDWVGGGGLADGLQKLVSNTLGNVEHYKAAAGKTVGLASDVGQKAWMESGEKPKKDKKDDDKDKPKGDSSGQQSSGEASNNIRNSDRLGSKAGNTSGETANASRSRTPVAP
jgi:hypothetical protein